MAYGLLWSRRPGSAGVALHVKSYVACQNGAWPLDLVSQTEHRCAVHHAGDCELPLCNAHLLAMEQKDPLHDLSTAAVCEGRCGLCWSSFPGCTLVLYKHDFGCEGSGSSSCANIELRETPQPCTPCHSRADMPQHDRQQPSTAP